MTGDLVGTVVGGKYKVLAKLGTGSMGDVYEAEDVDGGWTGAQRVALKVLRLDDDNLAARFLREAKTMSLFAHPNIVELVEVGKLDDGRLFFAAELVRGDTLRTLIDAGPVEPKRALAIVRQILDALGHAHAMGVVHRDIKPENVMLGDGDAVKILDFGVAKLIGDTPAVLGEGTLTITGYGALGTPYYMSPEAVLGRAVDGRADLYSVGAVLFEMLTGKPPFTHEDVAVLMRMHAAAPIPVVPEASPELALLVTEALAKKPEQRFQSAAEMIAAVDRAVHAPVSTKSTDVFGALPMKPPAIAVDPSASKPAQFSPASIPSASQPVQPEPVVPPGSAMQPMPPPDRAKRSSRVNLPGVAPYETPVKGSPVIAPAAAPVPHAIPPSAPLFSPPMPPVAPKAPHPLVVLAKRHRTWILVGAGAIVLLVVIAVATSGGKKSGPVAEKPAKRALKQNPALAREAADLLAAGKPSQAAALIEREEIGDDPETLVVLGHARIAANRRLDGLAAYERAIRLDDKQAADPRVKANVQRVLESRDAAAAIVALELALRLEPPAQELVKQVAATGKLGDVRRRALAVAERESFSDGIDRVESWSLDLAQATTCEDRLVAIAKLRRSADPRAIPALKRAKTVRCVEREVNEAIAYLEAQPAPPAANP